MLLSDLQGLTTAAIGFVAYETNDSARVEYARSMLNNVDAGHQRLMNAIDVTTVFIQQSFDACDAGS